MMIQTLLLLLVLLIWRKVNLVRISARLAAHETCPMHHLQLADIPSISSLFVLALMGFLFGGWSLHGLHIWSICTYINHAGFIVHIPSTVL
jgi:hypothetical protein